MRAFWALLLSASCPAQAQAVPDYSRPQPKDSTPLRYSHGRIVYLGIHYDLAPPHAELRVEDKEGRRLETRTVDPNETDDEVLRIVDATPTHGSEVVTSELRLMRSTRVAEHSIRFGAEGPAVTTGNLICDVIAASDMRSAWCLGIPRHVGRKPPPHFLFYRILSNGKIFTIYPLPADTRSSTPDGVTRFPHLGTGRIWANPDGLVWAWLARDRKIARLATASGAVTFWDVPVGNGMDPSVGVAVSPDSRVFAMLPLAATPAGGTPGLTTRFGVHELNLRRRSWTHLDFLPKFSRGVKLIGADASAMVISNRATGRIEWYSIE